jgi:putative hemolysin
LEQGYLPSAFSTTSGIVADTSDLTLIIGLIVLVILLIGSALVSAAEVAYLSLKPEDAEKLKTHRGKRPAIALRLLEIPERLVSTILVANNTINISIIILAAFLSFRIFDFSASVLKLIILAVAIVFILLLLGEILPKVYATRTQIPMVLLMAHPLNFLEKIFRPVTSLIVLTNSFVKKRTIARRANLSMDDLSNALDLASEDINEDERILKGIVNFGNINVSEIMCPRIDVTALNIKLGFNKVKAIIIESGFSRIPVYAGSFDSVKGVLYAKDILPYTGSPDNFKWQSLMRPPHFVPETKKINELLKEFQVKRNHMAIVIDEYGGTSGIVTLEDVLEEIVGEITDESDEDHTLYRKIDEKTFIFEGKVLLNDFFKIIEVEGDPFEAVRGESETLAGLILELTGEIPQKGKIINYRDFKFRIESADKRRIKEIRVELAGNNEIHNEK